MKARLKPGYICRCAQTVVLALTLVQLGVSCSGSGTSLSEGELTREEFDRLAQRVREIDNKISLEGARGVNSRNKSGQTGWSGRESWDTVEVVEVFYDTDDYRLKEQDKAALDLLANTMSHDPSSIVEIYSYADHRGTTMYNYLLSDQRARTVSRYLVGKFGIPLHRIQVIGFGEDYSNATKDVRDQGWYRRSEIRLLTERAQEPNVP